MKKLTCSALACGLVVLINSVSAQRPAETRPTGGPPGGATGLFGIFDSNDDKELTEDEVPGPVWDRLSAADEDKDGSVTVDEVVAFRSGRPQQNTKPQDDNRDGTVKTLERPQGPPWAMARQMFQRFDDDRDGALVEDEVPGPAWKYLSQADADKDGAVTQNEVIGLVGSRLFRRFDDNGDGSLSAEELPRLMWDRLVAADADDNKGVSLDEFVDAILSAPRGRKPVAGPSDK